MNDASLMLVHGCRSCFFLQPSFASEKRAGVWDFNLCGKENASFFFVAPTITNACEGGLWIVVVGMRSDLCGGRAHYLLTGDWWKPTAIIRWWSVGSQCISERTNVVVTQFGESFLESTHKKIAKILLLFRKMSRAWIVRSRAWTWTHVNMCFILFLFAPFFYLQLF